MLVRVGNLWLVPIVFCLLNIACNSKKDQAADALFQLLSPGQTHIDFTNTVADNEQMNIFNYHNFYNGGGVAAGDINNDGKPDLFFTSNQGENKLYLNTGNFTFKDVTVSARLQSSHHWHTGVTMADVNADGWLDIYVSNAGILPGDNRANELYINQHNGTFTEEAAKYGLDDKGAGTQAVFFDYDHDGDLDCFVLNNSPKSLESFGYTSSVRQVRDSINGDRLYRNDAGSFKDASAAAGIYGSEIAFGLGIAVSDLNNDGWEDIYVSNDFFEKDYLYINQHNGTFKEVSNEALGHMSNGSMGTDIADINNDGYLDVFTAEMLPESDYRLKTTVKFDDYDVQTARNKFDFHHQLTSNSLQLNNKDGSFSEIAQLAGVDATGWSWGALSFDFDNDGWKDIYVCNGLTKDLTDQDFLEFIGSEEARKQIGGERSVLKSMLAKMPSVPLSNYAFKNKGDLTFVNQAQQLGLAEASFSNGATYADLDGDGYLDLVVNNVNQPAFVFKNRGAALLQNHFVKIALTGNNNNTFGIGASVSVYIKNATLVQVQMPTRGFQSSVEPILTFGTGNSAVIDSIVITWNTQQQQTIKNVKADTLIHVSQGAATLLGSKRVLPFKPWYTNVAATDIIGNIQHHENDYVDFDIERLMPKMLSEEGPKIAVADVNGDGLDDFFVGSAFTDTAKIFIQQRNGHFVQKVQEAFIRDKFFENVGAAFFDADNDGDADLLLAAGGNQAEQNSPFLQPRLYVNDGNGNFTRSITAIPGLAINASCVRISDFNNDGKPDIFIGARNIRGQYGVAPPSALLQNLGTGNFANVTKTIAPELLTLGMVTDARWVDTDANKSRELVIVGDWMPVTIFGFEKGRFHKLYEVPYSAGWWNCLEVADLNNDGKPDLIAGNFGLNSNIKADRQKPARLYVGDFDKNGQSECIPVYYKTDGKAYPYALKGELQAQIPELKKRFLQFKDYAGKTMEEIFTAEQLKRANVLQVQQTQTCLFVNTGNGFTMVPLPVKAQLSPVFATYVGSGTGGNQLFLAGNFYGVKPQGGRFDASYGTTFLVDTALNFTLKESRETGLFVRGEVRDIAPIKVGSKVCIAVAVNNSRLCLFKPNN